MPDNNRNFNTMSKGIWSEKIVVVHIVDFVDGGAGVVGTGVVTGVGVAGFVVVVGVIGCAGVGTGAGVVSAAGVVGAGVVGGIVTVTIVYVIFSTFITHNSSSTIKILESEERNAKLTYLCQCN